MQNSLHDLGELPGAADSSHLTFGALQGDTHHKPGVLNGRHTNERCGVSLIAAFFAGRLCGTGFTPDTVPVDLGKFRLPLSHHILHEGQAVSGGFFTHHTLGALYGNLMLGAVGVDNRIHNPWLHFNPQVTYGLKNHSGLKRGLRKALAEKHREFLASVPGFPIGD